MVIVWDCCTCGNNNPSDWAAINHTDISPYHHCDHRYCYGCGFAAVHTGREQVTVPGAMSRAPTPMPGKRKKKKGVCVVL
jgi:hypothetical protein